MLNCNHLLLLIFVLCLLLLFKKKCKMMGGTTENTIVTELETMVKNKDLTDNQNIDKFVVLLLQLDHHPAIRVCTTQLLSILFLIHST